MRAHQRAHFPPAAKKVPLCDGRALCRFVFPAAVYSLPFHVASRMIWKSAFGRTR